MSLHQREYWYSCIPHTLFPFFYGAESLTSDLCCEPSPTLTIVWEEKHTSVLGALIYSSSDVMFATGAEAKITSQIPCYAVAYLSLHRANNSSKNTPFPQLSSFVILVLSWLLQ